MAARPTSWIALGFLGFVFACSRKSAPDATTGAPHCFSIAATQNSPKTLATFAAKQCQGGGVTWAALLSVLARRRGKSVAIDEPTPGFTGDVRQLTWDGRVTRFAIDEEGDAALFCADSQRLADAIQSDVNVLNAQTSELLRAISEADPLALECFPGTDAR